MQTSPSITATPTASSVLGNIIVYVKGCSNVMDSSVFTIKGFVPTAATSIIRHDNRNCINYGVLDTIMFSTPMQHGLTYLWSVGAGFSIVGDSTLNGVVIASSIALTPNPRTLTVRIVSDGCGVSSPFSQTYSITTGHGSTGVNYPVPPTVNLTNPFTPVRNSNQDTIGRRLNVNVAIPQGQYRWEVNGIQRNAVTNFLEFRYEWATNPSNSVFAYVFNPVSRCWARSNPFMFLAPNHIIPSNWQNNQGSNSEYMNFAPMNAPLQQNNPSVNIYPNPTTNGEITINPLFLFEESMLLIQIYNQKGMLVHQQQIPTNTATGINLSHLQNGSYFATIVGKNRTYDTLQISIAK
jgi:hypothetical protein